MQLDTFRSQFFEEESVAQITSFLKSKDDVSLRNVSGSLYALTAFAVIEKIQGFHLFIQPDKEQALYLLNDLENIIQQQRGTTILFYPASYRRPYQIMEADPTSVLQRTEVINALEKQRKKVIIVTYPEAIVEKVIDRSTLKKQSIVLNKEEEVDLDFLNDLLIELQFDKVDYVYEPGQFAIRGGILDIYSFGNEYPFRIEFFGDIIESLREFNPENQLSIKTHQRVKIIPNINDQLIATNRISFLDHLPKQLYVWGEELDVAEEKMNKGFNTANEVYQKISDKTNALLPVEMYLAPLDFKEKINEFVTIESGNLVRFSNQVDFNTIPQPTFNKNFDFLVQQLVNWKENGFKIFICAEQDSQLNRLKSIFNELDQEDLSTFVKLGIHEGFIDNKNKKLVFTDHQIFERYHRFNIKKTIKKAKQSFTLKEVYNLNKGDFVVHIDHGIGEFSGLEKIDVQGKTQEAIRLIYKGGDILYVSIHSLHRISKYANKEGTAPVLNKLGSGAWAMAKQKAKKKIKEVAYDLIKLYAKRKMQKGFSFQLDTYLQNELEASFMYEDTPDQLKATVDVKKDMESTSPMDRLICGDVGFGKTEIAIRAAFKAVADNKQVAVLVPTTVLVFQHYKTFSERLKNFPCNIDYLNRFKSTKKAKETIQKLKEGKVDIVIGTHRLISKDVQFQDLGLLIIDEEQKFGVGVKDQLKNLKINVDTLTLTATPIPRTLQFSLMSARDLSIINTPPPNRFPVETIVQAFTEDTIRDAISYELDRSGQVFFIHNRVQNINEVASMIERLCPHARVAVGHGQMEGKKLEAVILDFMDARYDVLVATTIVESGIDIPNANTIIINNANHFGLSDLHQLRGRVGRSNKKAFAYLFTPPPQHISTEARKRLHAIEQFSELGSGFNIAMRDLDIRGAGDLLGANQSGFINDVGFETYQKILDEAILELKENEFKDIFKEELLEKEFVQDCTLETDFSLVIPDDYVNEIEERLSLYKKLDQLETADEISKYNEELKDRFGAIPNQTKELIKTIPLRNLAKKIGFEKIIIKNNKLVGKFISNNESYFNSKQFSSVLNYVQQQKSKIQLKEKNNQLLFTYDGVNNIENAVEILEKITLS